MSAPDLKHINQVQLARRWSLSPRTLERWRWRREGPSYLKIGGRVVYRLEDIEVFEASQMHRGATASSAATFIRSLSDQNAKPEAARTASGHQPQPRINRAGAQSNRER